MRAFFSFFCRPPVRGQRGSGDDDEEGGVNKGRRRQRKWRRWRIVASAKGSSVDEDKGGDDKLVMGKAATVKSAMALSTAPAIGGREKAAPVMGNGAIWPVRASLRP